MTRNLLAFGALALAVAANAAPTCVYRNGNNDGGTSNFLVYNAVTTGEYSERGDTVTLAAGTPRNITDVSLGYFCDVAAPTGTESVIIRFYPEGTTTQTSGAYTHFVPDTASPIWTSAAIPITGFGSWRVMHISVPNITVPDTFIWTAQFINVAGVAGNRIGWRYVGPPTIGACDSSYWRRNTVAGGFTLFNATYTTGTTQEGSYEFTMHADGGPVGVVYDNTLSDNRNYFGGIPLNPSLTQTTYSMGDDINLESSYNEITQAEFELYTDVTVPQGDEMLTVLFYDLDQFGNGLAAPFFTSAPVAITMAATPPDYAMTTVAIPNVTVPERFICAIQVTGTDQIAGDNIGWRIRSSPNPGQSEIIFPGQFYSTTPPHINGWLKYWYGNPTRDTTTWPTAGTYNNPVSNFSVKLTASTTQNLEYVTAAPGPGSTIANTAASVLISDDVRWEVRPGAVLVATNFPERVTWTFRAKSAGASALSFTIESSSTVANMRQRVFIQHDNASFTELEDFTGLPTGANPDRSVTLAVPGTLSDYIRNDGTITVRTEHKNTTAVLVYPWRVRYDRVYVTHTQ